MGSLPSILWCVLALFLRPQQLGSLSPVAFPAPAMASPRDDDTSATHSRAGEASESEDSSRGTQNTDLTELTEELSEVDEHQAVGRRAKRARSESSELTPTDAAFVRTHFQKDVLVCFDGV